ncbi:MAG: class I SAM-dependent methyltransferase [Sphingomicrobium sp.]
MKKFLKRILRHPGFAETAAIRQVIDEYRRTGYPHCSVEQGDLLYQLAARTPAGNALEVGCASGSTALHLLAGMPQGRLTSIDFAHEDHDRTGEKVIAVADMAARHQLIERNSVEVLPELYRSGEQYDVIFLDGWKTIDHLWVDTFYCAKMLRVDGAIVFDDARMASVRKAVELLKSHYQFEEIDIYRALGGHRLRAWHLLTTHSFHPPTRALRKVMAIEQTHAGREYNFDPGW